MTQLSSFAPLAPMDSFNRELEAQVHPPTWRNPEPRGVYQLVVIGAGTAGLVAAAGAAGLGARVALVERELMGGDCLNVGCVPSKAIIRSARIAALVRESEPFGVATGPADVDFSAVMQRMRRLRAGISPHDSVARFTTLGVDVYLGQASFLDERRIQVASASHSDRVLSFRKAVIATGARASAPEIPGLESVAYLTNETLFSLTELPRRLGIVGSGPIGSEMAQVFARLGSDVALFERSSRILPREESTAARVVQSQLQRDGVRLYLDSQNLQVEGTETGSIVVASERAGESQRVEVDRLLVAVGRAPNTEDLKLDAAGVEVDGQGIRVNDYLQTTNRRIFAAGDVCATHKFTHAADFQARAVIQNALFALGPLGRKRASSLLVPWATYTSPELAHVGMYEQDATRAGIKFDVYEQSLAEVDRAILDGQEAGMVRALVKKGTDKILGATVVAEHAGDLISELTLAMQHGIGLAQIGATIHPYPTQADAIRKLGDQYNRSKLTPRNRKVLGILRWLNVGS